MSPKEVEKRFVEAIRLRAYDDKYIDKDEEREIARQLGITIDSARAVLAQVCESRGYVLESRVLAEIKDLIDALAGAGGAIDENEFNDAVMQCKKRTHGKKNDVQCKRMVVEVIEGNRFKVKMGLFNKWYERAKKGVGLAERS